MGFTMDTQRQNARTKRPAGQRTNTNESTTRNTSSQMTMTERSSQRAHAQQGEGLATFLGWFSVGLGLAEIVAPGTLARLIGVKDTTKTRSVMRAFGVRELAAGVGILSQEQPKQWLWGRVAGDVMDLAALTQSMAQHSTDRRRTMAATASVLGVTMLDVVCAQQLTRAASSSNGKDTGIHVQKSLTIRQPIEEVYDYWRQFENFPRFMSHLESVRVTGEKRSHWKATGPMGTSFEWDAIITEEHPNELLAWRSAPGSEIDNAGSVRFVNAPGDRGTEIHVDLHYMPPAGKAGAMFAKLFREEPSQQIQDDLRRLKQVLEIGEVLVSDATIHRGPHPAQPSKEAR